MALQFNKNWDNCLYNSVTKVISGTAMGFVLSFVFRRRVPCMVYGAGLGMGYGFVQCNRAFEQINLNTS